MKKIFLYTVLSFILLPSIAQKELQEKLQNKTKLSDIMNVVNQYFAEEKKEEVSKEKTKTEEEEESPYLQWKRWEYYMSSRLAPTGDLVNVNEKIFQAYKTREQRDAKFSPQSSFSKWSLIGPQATDNGIGRIDRIRFSPTNSSTIYLGTPAGGLWYTTNSGSSWSCLSNYISSLGVSGTVIDKNNSNILYVLTGEGDVSISGATKTYGYIRWSVGVLKSTDGGETWSRTGTFPGTDGVFYAGYDLKQDPNNASILLAATSVGMFKTINGGATWSQVTTTRTFDVEYRPGSSTRVYATRNDNTNPLIYSIDGGDSWSVSSLSPAGTNFGRCAIAVSPANSSVVYAVAADNDKGYYKGTYKSTDYGVHFTRINSSPDLLSNFPSGSTRYAQSNYDLGIAVSPTNINDVFVSGIDCWHSTNGGTSFSVAGSHHNSGTNTYIHADEHDVQFNPFNNNVYVVCDGGIWRSKDDGTTWTDLNYSLSLTAFYHGAGYKGDDDIFLGGTQDNGTKYRTSLGGPFFFQVEGEDGFDAVIDYNDASQGYCVGNSTIYKLTSLGNSNTSTDSYTDSSAFPVIEMNTSNPNIVYAGYHNTCSNCDYIVRTVDGGNFWFKMQGAAGNWAIATCPSNSKRLYAAGQRGTSSIGEMKRSGDGGSTWTLVSSSSGFPPDFNFLRITDICVDPTNSLHVWITLGGFEDAEKVFYSSNGGTTWANVSGSLPNVPINCVEVDNTNGAYIGTDIGVYYKGPLMSDWTPFYNGLPKVPVVELILNTSAGTIKAATHGRGVWESNIYSPCIANISISGNIGGSKFFEAANTVSSTGTLIGGEGTNVAFKAGTQVKLQSGFNAAKGNELRAYIGKCNTGGTPFILSDSVSEIDFKNADLLFGDRTLFQFANIESVIKNGASATVTLNIKQQGSIQLILVNEEGVVIKRFSSLHANKEEKITTDINTGGLPGKFFYLLLFHNGRLVHYQELPE